MAREKRISASRPLFSSHLIPSFGSILFRRRQPEACPATCCTGSTSPRLSADVSAAAGEQQQQQQQQQHDTTSWSSSKTRLVRAAPDVLRCMSCAADLALASQVISKGFTGRWGRAFLVAPPPPPADPVLHNIRLGPNEDRQLVTGWHVVADISCAMCSRKLGWKYVDARDAAQQYKVGNFILELARVVTHCSWEDSHVAAAASDSAAATPCGAASAATQANDIVFNLDDEQECQDLFDGVWNRDTVAKRRGRTALRRISAT